jgi:hypothetical protein
MPAVGVRLVGWGYRAVGVLAVLLAVSVTGAASPVDRYVSYPAVVLLAVIGVLCFALGSGMLRGKPWALAACPSALRPRSVPAKVPETLARPRPGRGIRIAARLVRAVAFLLAFLMAGIPMGVGEGELTPRTAYGLMALFGVLSLTFFVVAAGLLRAKR